MRIVMSDIKEVEVEKEKKTKIKLNQGKVQIIFDGFLETDYENRWESKAMIQFLRSVWDMWISKLNTDKYEAYVAEETMHFYQTIRSYLNLTKYKSA